jgi:hypothetical protein
MYDHVLTEDADVLKPDGTVLLKFRKAVLPLNLCIDSLPVWEEAATPSMNRGLAAGIVVPDENGEVKGRKVVPGRPGAARVKFVKKDGTVTKKSDANKVLSGTLGFLGATSRNPYCRMTAFTASEVPKFVQCLPLLEYIDEVFSSLMPERHAAQMEYWKRTHEDFRIPGTSFTTITANKNFRTAIHRDSGDLKQGFGVMTAFNRGNYRRGYTVFPKFRVAVDMRTTDLLVCDVHEYHGNDEIVGLPGTWTRISLVCYYQEKLAQCKSAEEERLRAIRTTEETYQKQDKELF